MIDLLLVPVAVLYFGVVLALFVFGLNFSYLTWSAFRRRGQRPVAGPLTRHPTVTIQLPIFNERYVAERLIDAAVAIRWPRQRIEIQVLDDSTDDTVDIAAARVEFWRQAGHRIEHVCRDSRHGFKAGALDHGLDLTDSEYVAIFDADFVPGADFLERTVPTLEADDGLAFVQGRWGHTNRNQSLLTRVQAMSIDGHFGIEQQARWAKGHCFNFNGTAGLWRRNAIADAGGWSHRTLTEDLDLSYRSYLSGWRGAYLHDLEVPAELPVSVSAYRSQQHRWARGSLQCAALLIPRLWSSDLRLRSKLTGTLHLGGYLIHLLLLTLVVLFPTLVLLAQDYPPLLSLFGAMAIFNLAALAPSALFLSAQHHVGRRWYRAVPVVVLLTLVGSGMMINTGRAAVSAMNGKAGVFERTAKFGSAGTRANWRTLGYQGRIDAIIAVEIFVAAICAATVWLAATSGVWAIAVYASIFGSGLLLIAGLTVWQEVGISRSARRGRRRWAGSSRDSDGTVAASRSATAEEPPQGLSGGEQRDRPLELR